MKPLITYAIIALLFGAVVYRLVSRDRDTFTPPESFPAPESAEADEAVVATFGTGCFWCTEAIFRQLKGVQTVTSGYTGGTVTNPTYRQVCDGDTGHAEAIRVTFDPKVISYPELLEVFWRSHDPTTLNRQGADSGTQYRSAIFYHSPKQCELAERYKTRIDEAKVYSRPIVTEIAPATEFYPAEAYHQNYFAANPKQGYCRSIIQPKLDKLKPIFADKLKQ